MEFGDMLGRLPEKSMPHPVSQSIEEIARQFPGAQSFGGRLRWVRRVYGLTLAEFGNRFNGSASYLCKLESGASSNPSPDMLQAICGRYRVREDWLLRGSGTPFVDPQDNERVLAGEKLFPPMPITPPKSIDEVAVPFVASLSARLYGGDPLGQVKAAKDILDSVAEQLETTHLARQYVLAARICIDSFLESPAATSITSGQISPLTKQADRVAIGDVKSLLPDLLNRLRRATAKHGRKTELATWLGVHPQCVRDWLAGRKEPGGETTLRLLRWVEQQEGTPP